MKTTKIFLLLISIALLGVIAVAASCGGGSGGGSGDGGGTPPTEGTSRSYYGSQVPGDAWTWTLGASTFSATNHTLVYNYSGNKETLASGFLKLTILSTNDPGITSLPAVAYAVEFPDTVLLIKPVGTNNKLIAAVALGACPATTENYIGVNIPHKSWSATDDGDGSGDAAYGTATFTPAGDFYTITGNKYLLDGTDYHIPLSGTITCAGGQFTVNGGSSGTGAMAPSRAFVVDDGPDDGGGLGMLAPTSDVDLTAVASKNYRGFIFKRRWPSPPPAPPVDTTEPVGAEPGVGADAGKLIGYCYTDVEANTRCSDNAVIDFTTAAQSIPGIVNVTLTDADGTHDAVMAVNIVNGKYMIFGISINTTATEPYNIMLIEQ